MRKNKGDVTYYLTKENDTFHLIKKVKAYSKKITGGKTKTTKVTISDFIFKGNKLHEIDLKFNGLRESDLSFIKKMVEELEDDL